MAPEAHWVRAGGGLQLIPSGERAGPADIDFPPPGGPWRPLLAAGVLVGWAAQEAPPALALEARAEGQGIERDRRRRLTERLGHKLRSSVLALQEAVRQLAFGRQPELEAIYEQAEEVGRRAAALEAVTLEPKDDPRAVVVAAVLSSVAPEAEREVPAEAVVRAPEAALADALQRTYQWAGGAGTRIRAERRGGWWRIAFAASAQRVPLSVPEMGEPLLRLLVDSHLGGWLETDDPDCPAVWLAGVFP